MSMAMRVHRAVYTHRRPVRIQQHEYMQVWYAIRVYRCMYRYREQEYIGIGSKSICGYGMRSVSTAVCLHPVRI
jgi:hypothetical protein